MVLSTGVSIIIRKHSGGAVKIWACTADTIPVFIVILNQCKCIMTKMGHVTGQYNRTSSTASLHKNEAKWSHDGHVNVQTSITWKTYNI